MSFERTNFLDRLIDGAFDFLDRTVGPKVRPVPGAKSLSAPEKEQD